MIASIILQIRLTYFYLVFSLHMNFLNSKDLRVYFKAE